MKGCSGFSLEQAQSELLIFSVMKFLPKVAKPFKVIGAEL